MSDIIVKIQPSPARRLFGVVILSLSALVMLNFAFAGATHSVAMKFTLFVMAVVFLWQAQANLRFGNASLILTREGLFDDKGTLICRLSNMTLIDRGWFSFKPSNGFLIRLREAEKWKWSPGIYWRIGRRLGVGGSISPSQTKEMSDKLVLLMQEKILGEKLL